MARWRIIVGVAIVLVLAVATAFVVASSLREEPTVASTEPVAAGPSPSPSPTAAPTLDPDPMPELHNTGEDFDRIIRSIEEFRSWLYRNPDPNLVAWIYHEECPCFEGVRERLSLLQRDGVRFARSGSIVHEVVVLARDPEAVALKVVDEGLPSVVVDANSGQVVETDSGREKSAYRFLLVKRGNGWLVRDIRTASMDLEAPGGDGP